jgi:hypothetical protein
MPQHQLFFTVAMIVIGSGFVFLLLSRPIGRMTHGVK